MKSKTLSYPIWMVKGDAKTPQRFWVYQQAQDTEHEAQLERRDFVRSNTRN